MKTKMAVAIALGLMGCGMLDRGLAAVSGIAHTCVDGVMYLQFTSGASVAYGQDGKIRTCIEK